MKYRTVQTMMLPDCAEENYGLYYQGTGGIQVQQGEKIIIRTGNEKADLFTYFNGFYPKQWSQYAQLDGLRIKVTVSGNCRVLLCHIDGSRTVVDEEKESRTAADIKNELVFEVSDVIENIAAFWICVEGLAQGGVLYDVDFQSAVEVQQAVRPAVVICTCRREKEVISNLERISRMDLEERPGIFLIDNGNTLTEEMVPDWVHLVPNRNCGGAGGFTRGMIEALKDPGFTHVILMDDDIVLNPEVLTKTMLFLSSVKKNGRMHRWVVPLLKEIFPGNSLNVELFGTEEGFRDAARIWICEREMLFLGIRNLRTGIMVAGGIAVYRYPQSGKGSSVACFYSQR